MLELFYTELALNASIEVVRRMHSKRRDDEPLSLNGFLFELLTNSGYEIRMTDDEITSVGKTTIQFLRRYGAVNQVHEEAHEMLFTVDLGKLAQIPKLFEKIPVGH